MGAVLGVHSPADHEVFEAALRTWRAREPSYAGADLPARQRELIGSEREVLRMANRLWVQAGSAFRIEKQAAEGGLDRFIGAHKRELVHVILPQFRASSTISLAAVMESIGMARAFRYRDADFSGIDGTRELFLSEIVHQAFVAVDEHGTEAAAATFVKFTLGAGRTPDPIEFRVDRPFLYFIRDRGTGQILFMGRVVDPSRRGNH